MLSGISGYIPIYGNKRGTQTPTFGSENPNSLGNVSQELNSKDNIIEKVTTSKTKASLFALGGLVLGGVSLALALGLGKTSQVNKALQMIDAKFADLCADLPKARKTFSEVFLRDISEAETIEMLNRYKEIEKLGVTASKEEYFQAIFKEAKNNYGLGSLPTEFKITDKPLMGNSNILGFTDPLGGVHIRSTLTKSQGFNTIHHELRHLKQRCYAFHYAPSEYVKASQPKNFEIPEEVFEQIFGTPMGKRGIPEAYLEFAENSAKSISNYCPASESASGYFAQWAEKDAYNAGNDITDFFCVV